MHTVSSFYLVTIYIEYLVIGKVLPRTGHEGPEGRDIALLFL
jgi:hypothetical protein